MQIKPGGHPKPWMASEDLRVGHVGLIWRCRTPTDTARFPIGSLAWLTAVDEYTDGGDLLRVRLYSVLPVVGTRCAR